MIIPHWAESSAKMVLQSPTPSHASHDLRPEANRAKSGAPKAERESGGKGMEAAGRENGKVEVPRAKQGMVAFPRKGCWEIEVNQRPVCTAPFARQQEDTSDRSHWSLRLGGSWRLLALSGCCPWGFPGALLSTYRSFFSHLPDPSSKTTSSLHD